MMTRERPVDGHLRHLRDLGAALRHRGQLIGILMVLGWLALQVIDWIR